MNILGFEIPGVTLVKLAGRLGNKTMGQLADADVQAIARMFKTDLDDEEATGIRALLVDDSNVGKVALQWVMSAADDPKFKQLKDIFMTPGRSATPELDLVDDDFMSRCPECHNPQLVELNSLPASKETKCVHCDHTYVVETR